MSSLRDQLAHRSGNQESQPEQDETEQTPEPHVVMQRIEQLFEEVALDHSRATELKNELDRLGLFELYEDRFLDLFSPPGGKPGTGPAGD